MLKPKLIDALQDYSWPKFQSDLAAGVVVGLVALPLAMAFAIASGLSPERGLYTAVIAGILISALGGSRVQIGGPTGAFVVIVAGIVEQFGYSGLVLATIMAGCILIVMGLARFGKVVKFIPYPVTTGFTSGIAVVIFSSQIKDLFGLQMGPVPADFMAKWRAYADAWPSWNPWAVAVALGTAGLIACWPKNWRRVPGPIVALVTASAVAALGELPIETIGSRFGGIPRALPSFTWPHWSWADIKLLFPSATTVAMLGAIESLLSAVVADGMIGGNHRSNMELIAQGVANIASPLFGGLPATGAIARTATNVKNGGRTPIAGIIHAFVLLLILMLAGPFAAKVPLAALTGILIVVCYHMSEWRSFRLLLGGPGSDRVVLLTTFFLTVFVDLTVAVEVGMVLAAFLFMRNIAELTQVKQLTHELANGEGSDPLRQLRIPEGVEVFSIHGAFFFAAVHKLLEVDRILARAPRVFVLDMTDVLHIDATGLHVLQKLHRQMTDRGVRFMIAGIHAQPLLALQEADQLSLFGEKNVKENLSAALRDSVQSPVSS